MSPRAGCVSRRCASGIPMLLLVTLLVSGTAVPAAAQAADGSHWGVSAGLAPAWGSVDTLAEKTLDWVGSIEGSEFTVGLVRGSTVGGEWGVSFVHKPFDDGTSAETVDEFCDGPFCSRSSERRVMRDVRLRGVEFHWFRPFGTIAERVQIGLNLAGGIARASGTIDETLEFTSTFTNPQTGEVSRQVFADTTTLPADEVLYAAIALFKVEVQGAIIVAPSVKIKIAGGVNNPGAGVRIGATYPPDKPPHRARGWLQLGAVATEAADGSAPARRLTAARKGGILRRDDTRRHLAM